MNNSFDNIQSDEFVDYRPTAEDWDEYNTWLDNQARNAWQDRVDDLQQPEDDGQLFHYGE